MKRIRSQKQRGKKTLKLISSERKTVPGSGKKVKEINRRKKGIKGKSPKREELKKKLKGEGRE